MGDEAAVPNADRLAVRWTVGDVRLRGFEMLRLSLVCAFRVFGPWAKYVVCVNTIPVEEARRRAGALPPEVEAAVEWRAVTKAELAAELLPYLDFAGGAGYIEGMGWKLAPLRCFPERYELAMDNDCVLWALPESVRRWLEEPRSFLFAEDVEGCFGAFAGQASLETVLRECEVRGLNAGIRGLPPRVDLGGALAEALEEADRAARARTGLPLRLEGEIEEQGLQAAAMARMRPLHLVRLTEVNLNSPFWPKTPEFGSCGAHFVGMNAEHIAWDYFDRPADVWLAEHWERSRGELYARAGLRGDM